MTTIDFAATTLPSPTRPAMLAQTVDWFAGTYRAWQNRRAFYRLGEMSDVELRDIGLTRGDLAVAVEFGSEATRRLNSLARSRANAMELPR